jgi:large repetitive protein
MSSSDFVRRRTRRAAHRLVAVLTAAVLAVAAGGAVAAASTAAALPATCSEPVLGVPGPFHDSAAGHDAAGRPGVTAAPAGNAPSIVEIPGVSAVSPSSGPQGGGNEVTVTGGGFYASSVGVTFGGVPASVVDIVDFCNVIVIAPASATTGTVDVRVSSIGGTSSVTAADHYTYTATLAVTGVSPSSGPDTGGGTVTVAGSGFTGAGAVDFGGVPAASFAVNSSTSITATAPAHGAGTVDVTVATPAGTSAVTGSDKYVYTASAPTVTGLGPTWGPASGGTSVTVTGSGFGVQSGSVFDPEITAVDFGTVPAASVTVISATSLAAIAPPGVDGSVDVTVANPAATSATSSADRFTYLSTPAVTAVNPAEGPTSGGSTVIVTGSGFTGASTVDFGSVPADNVIVTGDTSLTATAPPAASAGSVDVTVANQLGTSSRTSADRYDYVAAPAITGISPNTGSPVGGTAVTVSGAGFTGANAVDFGATPAASFTVNSDNSITAVAPAGSPGAVDITVTGLGGTSTTGPADTYTYVSGTVTTLESSADPSVVGQPVTITATVTALSPGSGAPTGTVTFTVDGTTQAPVTLVSGSASISLLSLPVGAHTVTAAYSGDADDTADTSAALTQTVDQAASTAALASSVNPSVSGQSVTFTATVTSAATGLSAPTGTVVFTLDGQAQAPVILTAGSAAFTATGLSVGPHTVTASYSGDTDYSADTSTALTQTVDRAATTTALTSSPDPAQFGQAVTVTATVTPIAPGSGTVTGTVTFTVDGTPQTPVTLVSGSASLSPATLGAGAHTITAVYSGDGEFTASTSAPLTQSVTQAAVTVALGSSANPSVTGQGVTITATVAPIAPATAVPTGTVTVAVDGTALAPVTLVAGSATVALPALAVGSHSITAVYSGDATYPVTTAPALSQSVNQAATTTALSSSADPSAAGAPVTVTATVTAVAPGAGTPTGQVVFTVDGTAQAPVALASGSATLALTGLAPGTHTVTAAYQGSTAYAASTSAALTQSVLPATTTTLASSVNPTVSGQNTSLTATVKPATGSTTPTGTVTFTIDGAAQAPVTLASGKASLKINTLAAGTHTITATYNGNTTFGPSTSAALTQTVNQAATTVTLSSSTNPAGTGQTVAFTAVVLPTTPGTGTPTGTVTFTIDGVAQPPLILTSGKAVTFKTNTLAAGTHTITATYSGDADYIASTSTALIQTVS